MTKIIIIPEETLDSYYERTGRRFLSKYHSLPTHLPEKIQDDVPYYSNQEYDGDKPIGKVIG